MNIGRWGEQFAGEYLEASGWRLLDRNFRSGHKEIDLVAVRLGLVAFVEVKTRRSSVLNALESITPRKQRDLAVAAQAWTLQHGADHYSYRFDAIAVVPQAHGCGLIHHVEDAWKLPN